MPKLNSHQLRTRGMVLGWLTKQRWNALSTENKIKIWLKVYDKEVPLKLDGGITNVFGDLSITSIRNDKRPLDEVIRDVHNRLSMQTRD